MQFGEEIKNSMFLLDKSVTFVNHGSYGLTVKPVMDQRIKLIYEQENQPDAYFRLNLKEYYAKAVAAAAEFLGAKKENLVLVDNITTGINTVIKCLKFEKDDQILIHDHTYNAVVNVAYEQKDHGDVEVLQISIPLPIKSEDDIVDMYKETLDNNPKIKVAIIDHITSASAIIFPIKKLIGLCRERGVLSVIDGAHAPGQLELDLEEIGADFYSGNFHKWCYVSRSCGFIWISPKYRSLIRPLVTSHGYKSSLSEQFYKLGTRDISNQLTLPVAHKFFTDIGGTKALTKYADDLLTFAQDIISKAVGSEKFDIPRSMRAPCMALVRLPLKGEPCRETADVYTEFFFTKYRMQAAITAFNGCFWIRCSANIYNTKEDYIKVKDILVKYIQEEDALKQN